MNTKEAKEVFEQMKNEITFDKAQLVEFFTGIAKKEAEMEYEIDLINAKLDLVKAAIHILAQKAGHDLNQFAEDVYARVDEEQKAQATWQDKVGKKVDEVMKKWGIA